MSSYLYPMLHHRLMKRFCSATLLILLSILPLHASEVGKSRGALNGNAKLFPDMNNKPFTVGELDSPVQGRSIYIRIFKLPPVLEIWEQENESYLLSEIYPICSFSGFLGPKQREGDRQSPEGFYTINARRLNPASQYHLSFDIGYPNVYDTSQGYTGSSIMIHGGCSSSGCFAMTDKGMEEIYTAVQEAFRGGQTTIPIHIFPFALTTENLEMFSRSPWIDFWKSMAPIYRYFEKNRQVPMVFLDKNRYTWQPVGISATLHP